MAKRNESLGKFISSLKFQPRDVKSILEFLFVFWFGFFFFRLFLPLFYQFGSRIFFYLSSNSIFALQINFFDVEVVPSDTWDDCQGPRRWRWWRCRRRRRYHQSHQLPSSASRLFPSFLLARLQLGFLFFSFFFFLFSFFFFPLFTFLFHFLSATFFVLTSSFLIRVRFKFLVAPLVSFALFSCSLNLSLLEIRTSIHMEKSGKREFIIPKRTSMTRKTRCGKKERVGPHHSTTTRLAVCLFGSSIFWIYSFLQRLP